MATAMNCTVKVYRGVPLVKGGTEVLYLSQGSAEGALAGYTIKTYTQYYYTREDENKIQVEEDIVSLEGANYVSFANISHGGKIYFGFIDHLRYVSDKCTEIQFTIDPFPTFLGDCTKCDYVYVARNTPDHDTRGAWLCEDYLPKITKNKFVYTGSDVNYDCSNPVLYFVCKTTIGYYLRAGAHDTAIQFLRNPDQATIERILTNSGTILGCYLLPEFMITADVVKNAIVGQTISIMQIGSGFRHNKIYSGVYGKCVLQTTQGVKFYNVEDFADDTNITFSRVGVMLPQPVIHVFPNNYKGVASNIAEGITLQLPQIPVSTPSVYTQGQAVNDIFTVAGSAIAGGAMAVATGGYGALVGVGVGALAGAMNVAKNALVSKFQPTGATQASFPLIDSNYYLRWQIAISSPDLNTLLSIDDYFDYYGYQIDEVLAKEEINEDDDAYLQTGGIFLQGSEGDVALNARLMNGIKIKKTL